MATGRRAGKAADGPPDPPAYYVAARALPVGTEMGAATLPVVAFQPGDRVPAEHVERYGWQAYVRAPDDPPPPAAEGSQLQSQDAAQGPDTGARSDLAALPLPAPTPTPQDGGDPPPADDPAADGAAHDDKEKP
jgi:hypothetical protein